MTLDDLIRYEPAAVAGMNVEKEPGLAIVAMGNFYKGILQEDDPIISRALVDASVGIESGVSGISNSGVIQAIGVYGKKYEIVFGKTKISDLTDYLSDGYKIPDVVKEGLKSYSKFTLPQLSEKVESDKTSKKEKANIGKVVQTIGLLRNRRLRGAALNIVDDNTTKGLLALYDEKKEE